MKKILAMVLVLMMAAMAAMAESGEEKWYVLDQNVLTVYLPAEDADWEFAISDETRLELLTHEETEGEYVASFTNLQGGEGNVTLALCRMNGDGTLQEVRRVEMSVDADGQLAVTEDFTGSVDEDFGLFFNPMGYDLFQVTDVYSPDSTGMLCVQGTFGQVIESTEEGLQMIGFDPEKTVSIALDEACTFLLPENMEEPMVNVEGEDIMAWYEDNCQLLGFSYSFMARLEMNEDGTITSLEHVYMP